MTVINVVNTIADISNWQGLGRSLELEATDIELIQRLSHDDPREYHQRLAETWFARDPNRSWEKLHRAMEEASARRGSYTSSIHSCSPVTPTSPTGKFTT